MSLADPVSTVDPGIVAAQRAIAGRVVPVDPLSQTPEESRRLSEASAVLWTDGRPEVGEVRTLEIEGPGGPLRARWFDPRAERTPTGALLFLHGGGWTLGSIDTHDRLMRCLAADTGRPVLGLDYRLSPEHPFPAALEDARSAFAWMAGRADALAIRPERIAVAGDSAGGNIGLALALDHRDRGLPPPCALALLYPCLAPDFETASHLSNGDGRFGLSTSKMRRYWSNYLGTRMDAPPALAAPLRADLGGLGPTFIGYAELDPLADDGRRLAALLTAAGSEASLVCWPGAVHGFLQMTRNVPLARAAVAEVASFLRPRL